MGALAEFERSLISERSKAGMQTARRRGKHIGRPHKLNRELHAHLCGDMASDAFFNGLREANQLLE